VLDCLRELQRQALRTTVGDADNGQQQGAGAQEPAQLSEVTWGPPDGAAAAPAAAAALPSAAPAAAPRARAAAPLSHLLSDVLHALAHGSPPPGAPGPTAPALEAPPSAVPPPELPEPLLASAGDLLLSYAATKDGAKLAAKLASALRLQRRHLRDWGALAARVQELIGDRNTCGQAVRLMMQIEVRGRGRRAAGLATRQAKGLRTGEGGGPAGLRHPPSPELQRASVGGMTAAACRGRSLLLFTPHCVHTICSHQHPSTH
jgi:hypothetical protein